MWTEKFPMLIPPQGLKSAENSVRILEVRGKDFFPDSTDRTFETVPKRIQGVDQSDGIGFADRIVNRLGFEAFGIDPEAQRRFHSHFDRIEVSPLAFEPESFEVAFCPDFRRNMAGPERIQVSVANS